MSIPAKERAKAQRHELLADVVDLATRVLKQHGLCEAEAQAAADEIVDYMVESWGGQYITIPKDIAYEKAKLYAAIKAEFDGSNQSELATKHNLSTNAIYKILKRK